VENRVVEPTIGYGNAETVMLDLDDTTFRTAKYWGRRTCKFHRLGGFILLKSSPGHYHVVFDRRVTWEENMSIVAGVVINSRHASFNEGLQSWFNLQVRKGKPTLRISRKEEKPKPRVVHHEGNQDGQIAEYLSFRRGYHRNVERKADKEASN
jgi:hypothetical protein